MDQHLIDRSRQIFEEATELAPADRAAFVAGACGGDAVVCAEVESLLSAADDAGEFLTSPKSPAHEGRGPDVPSMGAAPAEALLNAGALLGGRYTLLEQIGEGGFGVVHLGEQRHPVRRRVALKVIKAGMDSRQVVARFEAERQALALMDHPGIARVFDGGTTDTGRAYFVMELVEGPPITRYCDDKRLPVRRRLELFARVCDAMHHAHQKGVIHRDLKPTNVLVAERDGRPVPKVIDFGVAKAVQGRLTEHSLHTEQRQLIGTPEYMSPEQAAMGAAAVDARSDVYGLGVLLYELLTGATPFDAEELRSKSVGEIERVLREVEPPAPSERVAAMGGAALPAAAAARGLEPAGLRRALRGELDWVATRCLEKDPARRYESTAALAADVRRHLAGETVLARPTTAAYRLRKFVWRHKRGVGAAAAVAAALLLGVGGTTVGMLRARAAQGKSEAAEQQATLDKAAAEREAARAAEANRLMTQILTSANPDLHGGGRNVKVVDLLGPAEARLDQNHRGNPDSDIILRRTVGRSYTALGLHADAERVLRRADAVAREAYGPDGLVTLEVTAEYAAAMGAVGTYPVDAERLFESALVAARRRFGEPHPVTRTLRSGLAELYFRQHRTVEAEELLRTDLAVVRALPADPEPRTTLTVLTSLRSLAEGVGDVAEVQALDRLEQELLRRHPLLDETVQWRRDWAAAKALADQDRLEEANNAYSTLVEHLRARLGDDNDEYIKAAGEYADVLEALGQPAAAVPLRQQAVDALSRQTPVGTFVAILPRVWDLARALAQSGDRTRAEQVVEAAVSHSHASEQWRFLTLLRALGAEHEWENLALFAHAWALGNWTLQSESDPAESDARSTDLQDLAFELARWDRRPPATGASPTCEPVAAGPLGEARKVGRLPDGLYRLTIDVPRPGKPPLRRQAWVPIWPWELKRHRIAPADRVIPEPALWRGDRPGTQVPALVLAEGMTRHAGPGGSRREFGLVATARAPLPTGTYRFSAVSDDGVRVVVDGRHITGQWVARPAAMDTAVVTLAGVEQDLRVEFFQGGNDFFLWMEVEPLPPGSAAPPQPASNLMETPADLHLQATLGLDAVEARLAERPGDPVLLSARGHVKARTGRYDDAAADLRIAMERAPRESNAWLGAAALLLRRGDVEGHRAHCRRMLERFKDSPNTIACHRVARALLARPGVADAAALDAAAVMLSHAEGDRGLQRSSADQASIAVTRGLLAYRRGQYEDAAGQLNRARVRPPDPELRATAELFLAMSHHQLGRQEDALAALHRGTQILGGLPREEEAHSGLGWFGTAWTLWIEAHAARREAEALTGSHAGAGASTRPADVQKPAAAD